MASYGRQMQHHHHAQQRHSAHPPGHGQPVAAPGVVAPSGTFAPGTKIQVGGHRVIIQKYLSEGGFAHVYLVKLPSPIDGTDTAVLKRVAVPDKEALRGMRTEVETMKRLKGHRPIVTYIDSHASEMRGGGYEVFLLMEYCNGGGLIDFMNTRLQHRLTEPEILNIFADIAEGVACMHYLKPALLHRDIKVENILITSRAGAKRFKLCDFGSASAPRPAPTTVVECRLMDEDVQKHTTLQYRSPEMIDVYRKQPLNEKSDIWALGVLLYKLCYYTTPFEEQGQLAILNASYKFPNHPMFSDRLKKLIASMLKESLQSRPNIYQVLTEACSMQGRKVPIHDIYSGQQAPKDKSAAKPQPTTKQQVGASVSAPTEKKEYIPEIVPMRRGRPTPSPSPRPHSTASSRKVTSGDPFAALDSKSSSKKDSDELSSRFPSLDEFSILHEKGGKFNFEGQQAPPVSKPPKESSQRIADKLADSSFAASRQAAASPAPSSRPPSAAPLTATSSNSSPAPTGPPSKAPSAPPKAANLRPQSMQPVSSHNTMSRYVSTGTMTLDSPPEKQPTPTRKPVHQDASSALGRSSTVHTARPATMKKQPEIRPVSPETPKFDNVRGYSEYNAGRTRPVSTNFDQRPSHSAASQREPRPLSSVQEPTLSGESLTQLQERLVADATNTSREAHRQQASQSPPALRDVNMGNTIKKFEHMDIAAREPIRTESPPKKLTREELIPVAETESSWVRRNSLQAEEQGFAEEQDPEDMTPEMRREMERLQLEEEERRVAAAQAEYRERVSAASQKPKPIPGQKSSGGPPRTSSIQNRVQAYLNDDQKESAVKRTAQGYGKYTDAATAASKATKEPPEVKRKPDLAGVTRTNSMPQVRKPEPMGNTPPAASPAQAKAPAKPPAPKKPVHLNQLPTGGRAISPAKERQDREQLVAVDVPGQPALDWSSKDKDDYLDDFSKRFPSLSAIEGSRD
ncbi:Ark- serine/threonine protein kinase [Lecanicillium sp. MT-2017a]|nr:Ark- serine/threonine protein kinase [Lecanicillium sp. MT-2017a]